jgi:hypothetical protein
VSTRSPAKTDAHAPDGPAETTSSRLSWVAEVAERTTNETLGLLWAERGGAGRKAAVNSASTLVLTFCHVARDLSLNIPSTLWTGSRRYRTHVDYH